MIFKKLSVGLSVLCIGGMGVGIYYGVPHKKSPLEESDKSKESSNDKEDGDSTTEGNLKQQENSAAQTTLKLTSL